MIGGSNAGEALDPRDGVRERCPARESREPSDHKSRWRSSTAKRIPIAEGGSLRSRVPPKWHARFWSRGGGSDPSIDCNQQGMGGPTRHEVAVAIPRATERTPS